MKYQRNQRNTNKTNLNLQPKNPNNNNNNVIPIAINGGLLTYENTQPHIKTN